MIGFRADLPALAELVGDLGRFAALAERCSDDLDADVRRLGGHWQGAAASAHTAAHARWSAAQEQLRAALDQLQHLVSTAHRNYAAAAAANARMWA